MIDKRTKQEFQQQVWDFYRMNGRHALPWRLPAKDGGYDPYGILVSEMMLQQTQVSRVTSKFPAFLADFPYIQRLASAQLGDVIRAWSGLGYNRRAKFIWQAAQMIESDFNGVLPATQEALMRLPGVGINTAGAILAYAFSQPSIFIETNIRTVYIHHFFSENHAVADASIRAMVADTLDHEHVREWYWALMDYGAYLKQTVGNQNWRSSTYSKQTSFQGSKRQIRGQVLKMLQDRGYTASQLEDRIDDPRLTEVLKDLVSEDLVHKNGAYFRL